MSERSCDGSTAVVSLAGRSQEKEGRLHKPAWLKVPATRSSEYLALHRLLQQHRLNTVCTGAACPNRGECWETGTAAFMILGGICTRRCAFCAVPTGRPEPVDPDEPHRLAAAVRTMGLRHVVITSVDRDDLADGGATQFAACIRAIRSSLSESAVTVEVLTPDFRGKAGALQQVLAAEPTIFNHNMESVARLYPLIRPAASYAFSLEVLRQASDWQTSQPERGRLRTKSGIMLGLGERKEEVSELLVALREAGVTLLTVGQYLQPSRLHHPVVEYHPPERFADLQAEALSLGFTAVESQPLARSSFHAQQLMG
ncbi:MAG: lipoyl synthase [Magnetococcales bacterium]|nr:lipoyl synthase [Magnetococcales bacterium]